MNVLVAIHERRSIQFFDPQREVDPHLLRELLETANLAPSSFNLQPWDVITLQDRENKKKLRACAFDQPKVEEAGAVLILVANPRGVEEHIDPVLDRMIELGYLKPEAREKTRGMPFGLYGQDPDSVSRKLFAVKNAALFAMNLMVAARGYGLETHPMDGFQEDKVKEPFGIPQDRLVPMLIAVGHLKPGTQLLPRGYRRPVEDFVHPERF